MTEDVRESPESDAVSIAEFETEVVASYGAYELHKDVENPSQHAIVINDDGNLRTMVWLTPEMAVKLFSEVVEDAS